MSSLELTTDQASEALGGLGAVPDEADRLLERYALVIWNQLVEPGDGDAGRLIETFGPVDALRRTVLAARPDGGEALSGRDLDDALKRWRPRADGEAVRLAVGLAAHAGARLVTRHDAQWPEQIDDLGVHAPLCLWVRGDPGVLAGLQPSVAMVGARAATSYGEHVAFEIASELAAGGIPIVSGAAYGIDGAAHRAALSAGATTVALLAGGVDRPYPAGHRDLIDRIAVNGVVVSEVPCGAAPTRWRFLSRNRVIAAMSTATVVVEAGWRSGSINTAGHAAALGRAVGAVPGPITSAASAGCHRLLREYDAQCITGAGDVRELIGLGAPTPLLDERTVTGEATRVRDALSLRAWRDVDDIARRAGLSPDAVSGVLGLLRLSGQADSDVFGAWRLVRTRG